MRKGALGPHRAGERQSRRELRGPNQIGQVIEMDQVYPRETLEHKRAGFEQGIKTIAVERFGYSGNDNTFYMLIERNRNGRYAVEWVRGAWEGLMLAEQLQASALAAGMGPKAHGSAFTSTRAISQLPMEKPGFFSTIDVLYNREHRTWQGLSLGDRGTSADRHFDLPA